MSTVSLGTRILHPEILLAQLGQEQAVSLVYHKVTRMHWMGHSMGLQRQSQAEYYKRVS